jgi:tRNA(Ile)-lysidine synthase
MSAILTDCTAGIRSRISACTWRSGEDPAQLTNFETLARTLRYRRFASMCLEQDLKALFLGHHLSDQVETIIIRLLRGHRVASTGLRGMKAVNDIPCCEHIFGASDGPEASPVSDLLGDAPTALSTSQHSETLSVASPVVERDPLPGHILVSHGGIKIYRPLLSFPKARLLATCEANQVPYITDPSNFDFKTTKRNAVRWLLSNDKMPMALRQDSILRVGAASARVDEIRNKKLIELLNATQLVRFDIRSGQLAVIVPQDVVSVYNVSEREIAYYVDRLLSLVAPNRDDKISFLYRIDMARWMFPELRNGAPSELDWPLNLVSCTARDVLITRSTNHHFWNLCRRPFRAHEEKDAFFVPAPSYSKGTDRDWSKWSSWDGRYWIRIRTRHPENVRHFVVRRFLISDWEEVSAGQSNLSSQMQRDLKNALQDAAGGNLRYTIPVLVKGVEVRAFPTLDVRLPSKSTLQGTGASEELTDELQWEVRYKDISDTLQHLKRPAGNSDLPTMKGPLESLKKRLQTNW